MAMLVYQRVIPVIWVPHLGLQDRDRVVYLLRWLCTTCEVPFEGAPGEPEDSEGTQLNLNLGDFPWRLSKGNACKAYCFIIFPANSFLLGVVLLKFLSPLHFMN